MGDQQQPDTPAEPTSTAQAGGSNSGPEDVIDPVLYELTMAVVAEMDVAVAAYLAKDGYKYVPKRQTRKVSRFDSGWPSVSDYTSDTETPAHGKLFAQDVGPLHPLAYSDLESMAALYEYVESKPDLHARLQCPSPEGKHAEVTEFMFRYAVADLPGGIYDRAMALGLTVDSPAVVDMYRAKELSWLAPELPYELVVPLLLTDLEIDSPIAIDGRARFEALTDDDLRAMAVDYDLSGVPKPVALAAKYALVVTMPPMANVGETARVFLPEPEPELSTVRAVCEALRIASTSSIGWARVFRRPLGWTDRWTDDLPVFSIVHTAREYPSAFDNYGWLKDSGKITKVEFGKLPGVVTAMAAASSKARLAARRLSMADVRDSADDQLVDACIGLEALLGQEGAELSYRISVRAAALLSSRNLEPLSAAAVFKMVRKVYNRRSELVHGSTSGRHEFFEFDNGTKIPTHYLAVFVLRAVLVERLLRDDSWTVDDLDARVLERLGSPDSSGDKGTRDGERTGDEDQTEGEAPAGDAPLSE